MWRIGGIRTIPLHDELGAIVFHLLSTHIAADSMAEPYSTLPPKIYSLSDFNRAAKHLVLQSEADNNPEADAASREFVNFVLTGRYESEGHQVSVDPTRGAGLHQGEEIYGTHDFDSFLGITETIVVQSNIFIYPVSNPSATLTTSIHLKRGIQRGNVSVNSSATY